MASRQEGTSSSSFVAASVGHNGHHGNNGGGGGGNVGANGQAALFNRAKLYELVNSVAYGEKLDPPVEYALLKVAESFIVEVSTAAAELARHRRSQTIEPRDIQLYLEREWDMVIPGFAEEERTATATRLRHPTTGHQTRATHATRAANTSSMT